MQPTQDVREKLGENGKETRQHLWSEGRGREGGRESLLFHIVVLEHKSKTGKHATVVTTS